MQTRPATLQDAQAIAAMIRSAWAGKVAANSSGHKETAEKVAADLHKGLGWVVEQDGQMIATVRMTPHPREAGIWEMKKLGVLPGYRKHGLGPKLVQIVLDKASELGLKELRLAVRFDQYRLVEWYSQFGFVYDPALKYSTPNPNNPPEFVMYKKMEIKV
jgi:predicted N-acetyltransferase YhbS